MTFKTIVIVTVLSLPMLGRATSHSTRDWPMLRAAPEAHGMAQWMTESTKPIPEWHYRGRAQRRYRHGLAVWASPAVAIVNDRPMAFIGGYDQTLHALDLLDKRRVWARITNGEIQAPPAIGILDDRPVVFFGSADRSVYAHDAADGRLRWTRELTMPTSTLGESRLSAPLLHGGTLYICGFFHDKALTRNRQQAWLFAMDAATGQIRWAFEVSQGPVSSPVGREIDGRFIVYIAARKGLLQAIDVSGPAPRAIWRFQMPHEVLGSPAVEPDGEQPLLFLGSKFGNLIAIDARNGTERWQRMTGNWIDNGVALTTIHGEPAVIAGSYDYHVYAFRAADGSEIWRRRLGGEVFSAPVVFTWRGDVYIVVATLDDRLYLLDHQGVVIAAFRTGDPIWDAVARGETLWGSPVALTSDTGATIIHGAYNDVVYVLPVFDDCSVRVEAQTPRSLWRGMGMALAVFLLIVLPPLVSRPPPITAEEEPSELSEGVPHE